MEIARTGTDWDIKVRGAQLETTVVDGDTEDVAVTYTLTHNGESAGSGSLAWEGLGFANTWAARITLPATPGILIVRVTVSATIDGDTVSGRVQQSLRIEE